MNKRENGGTRAKNLTGMVFGRLTVIKRVENKRGMSQWLCRCTCGNEVLSTQTSLRMKKFNSCGCWTKLEDLTGIKFGRLFVIGRADKKKGDVFWRCVCDCGQIKEVSGSNLRNHSIKSCGCLNKEKKPNLSHGMYSSKAYRIWANMKKRCFDEKGKDYKHYGGRGITVCDKWLVFEGFWEDMKDGYTEGLSLDRIDFNGNYEPGNCRWVSIAEQQRNRRNNVLVTINGESKVIPEWARIYGINERTLRNRVKSGLTGMALLSPVKKVIQR